MDVLFGLEHEEECSSTEYLEYIKDLRTKMKDAFELAEKLDLQTKQRSEKKYNKLAKVSLLVPGDLVLIRSRNTSKISDKWSHEVHIVIEKPYPDKPLYMVKSENDDYLKSVHRNNLFLLGSRESWSDNEPQESLTDPELRDLDNARELESAPMTELSNNCEEGQPDLNTSEHIAASQGIKSTDLTRRENDRDVSQSITEVPQGSDTVGQLKAVHHDSLGPLTRSKARAQGMQPVPGFVERVWARMSSILIPGTWNSLQND